MLHYTEKIRALARDLLESGKVDSFIGYRKGTVPMVHNPVIIHEAAQADELIWDSNCSFNLCNYLTNRKDKVAILATGCASRNIVMHLREKQIAREQLTIIGVPCTGMIDSKAVRRAVGGREIESVGENGENVIVAGESFEETLKKTDVLQRNCATCTHRNPVLYDELVADEVSEQSGTDPYKDVKEFEAKTDGEKWKSFQDIFASCIRCYACRNACPLCYCPTCFVDESKPQWVGKSTDPVDTLTFHFLRAFHMAGRCTDCGSCEQACPMDIPLRYLTKKLNKDAEEIYGYEAGMSVDDKPLLDVYKMKDLNDFIR